ncbi:hypothetical protein B0H11DRAFT_1272822 [Mycena galericulata]|nr:hypothetical protein B0H11DRAFT_1272822 [Mycena galericulata]
MTIPRSMYSATGFSYRTPAIPHFIFLSMMTMVMNTAGPTVTYLANGFPYRTTPPSLYYSYDRPAIPSFGTWLFVSDTLAFLISVHSRQVRLQSRLLAIDVRDPTVQSIGIWLLVLDTPALTPYTPSVYGVRQRPHGRIQRDLAPRPGHPRAPI